MPRIRSSLRRVALSLAALLLAACATTPLPRGEPGSALPPAPSGALAEAVDGLGLGAGESAYRLVVGAEDAFALRMRTAALATRSIDVQYYMWHDDLTGRLLAGELLAAAQRGARVRVLVDDMYARGLDALLANLDAHPGLEIRLFNPFRSRASTLGNALEFIGSGGRQNRRMHNKLWLVDGRLAIVGGRNIGDEYFGANQDFNFGDLGVLLAGAAVAEAGASFDDYWNSAAVVPLSAFARAEDPPAAVAAAVAALEAHTVPRDVPPMRADAPLPVPPPWSTPRSLAYLIYTSGTTGAPKAVLIQHAGVVNLITQGVQRFRIGPDDRVVQGSSPAYDSSIEESWLALASGATMLVLDDEMVRAGPDLVPWLREEQATVFCPPPTLLRAMDLAEPRREVEAAQRVAGLGVTARLRRAQHGAHRIDRVGRRRHERRREPALQDGLDERLHAVGEHGDDALVPTLARRERGRRIGEHQPSHALRRRHRRLQRDGAAERQPAPMGARDVEPVEHRAGVVEQVGHRAGRGRAVGERRTAVAAQVHAQHPEPPLELRELRLPDLETGAERMQQQQRRTVVAARHRAPQTTGAALEFGAQHRPPRCSDARINRPCTCRGRPCRSAGWHQRLF